MPFAVFPNRHRMGSGVNASEYKRQRDQARQELQQAHELLRQERVKVQTRNRIIQAMFAGLEPGDRWVLLGRLRERGLTGLVSRERMVR